MYVLVRLYCTIWGCYSVIIGVHGYTIATSILKWRPTGNDDCTALGPMYNLNSNHVKPKRSQKILTKHPNSVGRFQCFERFDSFFGLVNSLFPWFVLFVRLLILPFSLVVMFNCLAFIITPYHFRKSSDSIHATCSIYVNLFRKSQWLMDYPEGRLWIVTIQKGGAYEFFDFHPIGSIDVLFPIGWLIGLDW
jgi:hypothetical protein